MSGVKNDFDTLPVAPENTDLILTDGKALNAGDFSLTNGSLSSESTENRMLNGKDQFHKRKTDFLFGEDLGEGAYGKVMKGICRETGQKIAIKMVLPAHRARITKEIQAMIRLNGHENIASILGHFSFHYYICLALEFVNGATLRTMIVRQYDRRGLYDYQAAKYIYFCAKAVNYCHEIGIVHRDIKSENVLISHDDQVKLIDFGFCDFFDNENQSFKGIVGTPEYLAPEILSGQPYSKEVDYWSMGILLFECLTTETPYRRANETRDHAFARIKENKMANPLSLIDKGAAECCRKLLEYDPKKRMSMENLMNHKWILQMFNKFMTKVTSSTRLNS